MKSWWKWIIADFLMYLLGIRFKPKTWQCQIDQPGLEEVRLLPLSQCLGTYASQPAEDSQISIYWIPLLFCTALFFCFEWQNWDYLLINMLKKYFQKLISRFYSSEWLSIMRFHLISQQKNNLYLIYNRFSISCQSRKTKPFLSFRFFSWRLQLSWPLWRLEPSGHWAFSHRLKISLLSSCHLQ